MRCHARENLSLAKKINSWTQEQSFFDINEVYTYTVIIFFIYRKLGHKNLKIILINGSLFVSPWRIQAYKSWRGYTRIHIFQRSFWVILYFLFQRGATPPSWIFSVSITSFVLLAFISSLKTEKNEGKNRRRHRGTLEVVWLHRRCMIKDSFVHSKCQTLLFSMGWVWRIMIQKQVLAFIVSAILITSFWLLFWNVFPRECFIFEKVSMDRNNLFLSQNL